MKKRLALVSTLFATATLALSVTSAAKDANSVLKEGQQAMGTVKSIQYSGTGMNGFFGQALIAGNEWPRRDMSAYTRTVNYEQRSARDEMTFTQPVFGGLQQNTQVNGNKAWGVGPNGPIPQLAAAEERQLQIWLTPHGFVNGALAAGDAKLQTKGKLDLITFTALGKYRVQGTLDAQHRVTRVSTKIANPVLGDTDVVAEYSEYRSFDGVQFPGKILIVQGGFPTWDLKVDRVTPNAPFDLPVPDAVTNATIPPMQVVSTKLADGVWHLTGGSHHSVLVEFKDYVAVIEAPQDENRSLAVLAEVQKLVPTKPVSYVLTTHHHFDHSGGLRTYAARGATVITHQSNVAYFQKSLVAPATIAPDSQSKSPKRAKLQGVKDKYVLTDGKQTIEVYATGGDTHTGEYTLVYLPGPKILVEGDAYSPGPAGAPPPATPPPNAVMLNDDLQRLKLDVAVIAPIHGRGAVPMEEMMKALGKT